MPKTLKRTNSRLDILNSPIPGSGDHLPISRLKVSSCLKWLNPRRRMAGLAEYPVQNTADRPPVEDLRKEIVDFLTKSQEKMNRSFYSEVGSSITDEEDLRVALDKARSEMSEKLKLQWNDVLRIRMKKLAGDVPLTNLWVAAYHGRKEEVLQYLDIVNLAVDTPQPYAPNQTALHCAAVGNNIEMVQILLDRGAQIDTVDANGNTCVHLAARWGHQGIVELLLKASSDKAIDWNQFPNRLSQTPPQLAAQHLSIVALFSS